MEFHMETRQLQNGRSNALVITKWSNLGRGDHPSDQRWRRHLYDYRALGARSLASRFVCSKGDFRKPQAELTKQIAAILETDSFLKTFERAKVRDREGRTVDKHDWTRMPA